MASILYALRTLGINPIMCGGLLIGYVVCVALKGNKDKLIEFEKEVKEKRLKEENKRYTKIENVEDAEKLFK